MFWKQVAVFIYLIDYILSEKQAVEVIICIEHTKARSNLMCMLVSTPL